MSRTWSLGLLLGAIVMALGACTTKPAPVPEPIIRTVRVEVPVPTPCAGDVPEDDIDLAPLIKGASDILPRVEILLDALEYVTAQRDAERAARKACNSEGE